MNRRRFLAALGATSALAGCLGNNQSADGADSTDTPGTAGGSNATRTSSFDLPVPKDELRRGAPKDAIPAITAPVFSDDWSGFDEVNVTLEDSFEVVGVELDGIARAYPLAILNWHEIANDAFDDRPVVVTYCPLCGSAVVADRLVAGEPTNFGVSGYLWMSDLVMYDVRTESLWSQVLATAIRGERTGDTLSLIPSTISTWGEWKASHPDTEVLVPPPVSDTIRGRQSRSYDVNPYSSYRQSGRVGIGFNDEVDERMHPKTSVIGITAGGVARAYPLDAVKNAGVVNDTVGELPVVVASSTDGTLVAYVRRIDGSVAEFERDGSALVAAGSRWDLLTGRALDGSHEGATLTRANDRSPMFWFAWADFNPDTEIYGR
ncbi:DUF3179 domain-containing protein [Haloferax mediterranei ATCC 33500]|nr:DUF3179 domain-containing protein [Haloferax mediterranei]AFK19378.2 hypothetical protein HFX_1672 [Haloferax mediterranei ATCC 33500]AHZ21271.1 hypothetical protein BM92_00750 [Haloferax mediterranei ATCC 33500]MDX5989481.1 DUF3179 domain-containing protein [Haloferax mediterranei ATCC 33500]QCQ75842.1 DUF3179 domain-containing protein [Haloferax mediterranei ATCC 33500]